MRILRGQNFKTSPWKNGGGVTHEIARSDEHENFGWRLSVADIKTSGAFSLFPDYLRVLTVIAGKGMRLVGAVQTLAALPLVPVHFSGAEPIQGALVDGPCVDFNLIYDPKHYVADVVAVTAGFAWRQCFGIYVQVGHVGDAAVGDFIVVEDVDSELNLSANFRGLAVYLAPL